ncbi:MAG: hypothetical protein ACRCTK_00660 [Alphaproteobacteria bacterium]
MERLQQIRAAHTPDSSLDDSSLQPASGGLQRSLGNAGATSGVISQNGSGFPEHSQAFDSTLNHSTSDPGPVSFDLNTPPPTGLTRSYKNLAISRNFLNSSKARALGEALQQRNRELAVPSVDGSGRQEPSGFTASWATDWDTNSYYSHGPQDAGSLPPLPPRPLCFSESDADGNASDEAGNNLPQGRPMPLL